MKWSWIGGLLTMILSGFAAYDLSLEVTPCVVMMVIAIIIIIIGKEKRREDPVFCWFLCGAGLLVLCFSTNRLIEINRHNKSEVKWQEYVHGQYDAEERRLKALADDNDGPSQFELARYYYLQYNYPEAHKYANKAANNGNHEGYLMLERMDLLGLGRKKDVHEAAKIIRHSLNTDGFDLKAELNDWESIYSELSSEEIKKYEAIIEKHNKLSAISNEAKMLLDPKNPSAVKPVFSSHKKELESLSSSENILATEMLYLDALCDEKEDSIRIQQLAELLYNAGHIPSGPIDRAIFFGFLRRMPVYSDSLYAQHIHDRNFAFLASEHLKRPVIQDDCSNCSDEHLIRDYLLFRAQYDEMKLYAEGKKRPIDYMISAACDYQVYQEYAKRMLETNVAAIQKRLSSFDSSEQDTTKRLLSAHEVNNPVVFNKR